MTADLDTTLSALITTAERSLSDQTGGQNVCQLHKDGRVTGGVKYDEGRLVALNTARRRLRAVVDAKAHASFRADLERELEAWRGSLQAQQARERPAIAWVAYSQGGIDALEQVLTLVGEAPA